MAKIIPMILIESMSGKVCGHSDTYFALRNGVHIQAPCATVVQAPIRRAK